MTYLLQHYLAESVARDPHRPAVQWRDIVLSYGELDDLSTRLAILLAQEGIGPGTRVGMYLPKSHKAVVTMLAVLKAGAAYVPVDPNAPAARAAYILRDCAVRETEGGALINTATNVAFAYTDTCVKLGPHIGANAEAAQAATRAVSDILRAAFKLD